MSAAARAVVRRRRVEVAVISVVAAVLLGGALSAAAGARRSSSAVDRFLAYAPPEDLYLVPPDDGSLDVAKVEQLPQVLAAEYESYLAMVPIGADGRPQLQLVGSINPFIDAPIVGPRGAIARRRVVHGRDLDLTKPNEVVIDEELARDRNLRVGSHLKMAAYSGDQLEQVLAPDAGDIPPAGPRLDLTVVGIVRTPGDIHPGEDAHTTSFGGTKDIYLTPALYEKYGDGLAAFSPPVRGGAEAIRLVHGAADTTAFSRAVRALPGGDKADIEIGGSDAIDSARTAGRAISVETTALVALAALLGLAGLVLVAHASARLARRTANDLVVLRAIGLRPRELVGVAAAPALVAGIVGVALALVVAIATSSLTPIGLGRLADVDPGVHADWFVLGVGLVLALALTTALAVVTALPAARAARARSETSPSAPRLAHRLAGMGAPLGPTLGGHFATGQGGIERSAPVRTAMVVGAVALLVLVGVATYTASLDHLSATPADQGVTWDVTIGNPNLSAYTADDAAKLATDPRVAAVLPVAAPASTGSVDGLSVTVAGIGPADELGPPVVTGRLPARPGEVALGRRTASRLHAHVGSTVKLAFDGPAARLTVVGTALLNPGLAPTMQIGDGALVSLDQLQKVLPDQPVTFLLARLRPGVDRDAAITALKRDWGRDVSTPVSATDIVNLDRVRSIPVVLALALGGGAAALLAFALIVSVTNRRRELGVLRALGATRRQLTAALAWQAVWLYGVAALIGVPLGIVVGRLAWRRIDTDLGALVSPVVPVARVLLVAAVGLAVALLLAYVPARLALRTRASQSLRTE